MEAALGPRGLSAADEQHRRAVELDRLGRTEEARDAYLSALAADPTHFGALNDLGALLHRTHFRAAARTVYAEAVRHHPDNPVGRINLANALAADGEADAAKAQFQAALALARDHPDAHLGLARVLSLEGDEAGARRHLRLGQGGQAVTRLPLTGKGAPCRVLLLTSALGGTIPTRALLDEAVFETTVLTVEAFNPKADLPAHDVAFNAIGDADLCALVLEDAARLLAKTSAPIVNPPDRVLTTGRLGNARRLGGLEGVIAPRVELAARQDLTRAASDFGYPLLLRSPGYHTGQHFKRIDRAEDLAVADLPGERLLMIQPLNARDGQGRSRKFRVMMIGGRLYPLHLAVSDDWKVHYFTSAMADRPDLRAEEAAFLADMPGVLGAKAVAALEEIQAALGLDYAGVDFGLGPDGEVLLFEANATMVINPPDPEAIWDYRRAPVARALLAARDMLLNRAGR